MTPKRTGPKDRRIGPRTTHGMSKTRIYRVWKTMHERCVQPANKRYKNYGGRGIKVCERWNDFLSFLSDMGPRPDGIGRATIERIDNDGNYEPSNCRWASYKDQARNTRRSYRVTYRGENFVLSELIEKLGLHYGTVYYRIKEKGWNVDAAVDTPLLKGGRKGMAPSAL